jgi:putative ABC transport system substrate-binding protein
MATMRRLASMLILAVALGLAAAAPAGAQPAGKVWRVAVLTGGVPRSSPAYLALERRLAELGYVEGRNLVIDFRTAESQLDRLPALAAELVGRRPDVIVASATLGALAAKRATSTIPIVLSAVIDPVVSGIVPSMARPGGNITGISLLNVELSGKALQLLKEAVPGISRVAVVWNSSNRSHGDIMKSTEAAAATLGVTLQPLDLRKAEDLPAAFDAITRARATALLVFPDPVSYAHRKTILEFAASRRLPAMYPFREMVDEGGLLCYGPNLGASYRAAAEYVDKILKGARPGDLPIAPASRFDLVVNLRTAKVFGLTIPQSILVRADDVVQ